MTIDQKHGGNQNTECTAKKLSRALDKLELRCSEIKKIAQKAPPYARPILYATSREIYEALTCYAEYLAHINQNTGVPE